VRKPLRYRDGGKSSIEWEGPFEGIPDWLWSAVSKWLLDVFRNGISAYGDQIWNTQALRALEQFLRTSFSWTTDDGPVKSLLQQCGADQDLALDAIDWCLEHLESARRTAHELLGSLTNSASVWTIDVDENDVLELQRRVGETVTTTVKAAANPGSKSDFHLRQSWSNVYGLSGDPSVAYREAVKAVEAAAIPIVSPANGSATLGTVIGEMKANPTKFNCALQPSGGLSAIDQVIGMLSLLWKAQLDRHGNPDPSAPISATPEEAEAALHLAATLVHWFDSGAVSNIP
jgi:hypothetical protein